MDIEQEEMQFLGLFGIYKESYKLISSCAKIFSKISLALILPLSFILLAHIEVTDILLANILHNEIVLDGSMEGTATTDKTLNALSKEWTMFCLFKAIYFTFLVIFSLLSTSAVVYTVACVYTSRDISFKKVMSVVPKVWKRLMATFLCMFIALFIYNFGSILILTVFAILNVPPTQLGYLFLIVLVIIYLVGLVYMSIIWQLASVVSVLEDVYGFQAMMKSKELIKGKLIIAIIPFIKINISFGSIQFVFERVVVHGGSSVETKTAVGILCLLLLSVLFLFGLVIHTVVYFVCKSYHHENIDKSMLSDHLEVYLGEYVPLKAKDVQLEHFYV